MRGITKYAFLRRHGFIVAVCLIILGFATASNGTEYGTLEIHLQVHSCFGTAGDDAKSIDWRPCPDSYVGCVPRQQLAILRRWGPGDWGQRVSGVQRPARHTLQIRNGDYWPKALLIREGDSVLDVEYRELSGLDRVNGIQFEELKRNLSQSPLTDQYFFSTAETWPIRISNRRNANREAYLFVTNHSLGKLTDATGNARLQLIPCGVAIPMRIIYPWRDRTEFVLQSETLKFDDLGNFTINIEKPSTVKHTVRIAPKQE